MSIKSYFLLFAFSSLGILCAEAQNLKISGKVQNSSTGDPLPGAAISVKGSSVTTQASGDGSYAIELPKSGSVIVVSFVGMKSIERTVQSPGILNLSLSSAGNDMGEIVVIGYGSLSKRNLTTAVSTVNAKTIESLPVYSLDQALQGTAPGVVVAQTYGSPGAPLTVRVLGTCTVGNTQPLYIVDGMQVPNINYLNSFDIDNISVLKDAASAAIYGSRGGNGVVLIQTKQGRRNMSAPSISFDGYYGIQNLGHTPDLMNRDQYVDYFNQYANKAGITPITDAGPAKTSQYELVR